MTALIVTTSVDTMPDGRPTGAYASELAECWWHLRECGYDVAVASVRGGPIPVEARRPGDALQDEFFEGVSRVLLTHSVPLSKAGHDFDVVCVVGGHGAVVDLPHDVDMQLLVERVFAGGGVVAAVCHGVAGLLGARVDGQPLLRQRRVAAFTDDEEAAVGMSGRVSLLLSVALGELGAVHDVGPPFLPHVVVHGRVVTGQNPASAIGVAQTAGRLAALRRMS